MILIILPLKIKKGVLIMSQVIRIPGTIYNRLAAHVQGFDTPANVIERLLDFYEEYHPSSRPRNTVPPNDIIELDPDSPGDLTHTRILNGRFGESPVRKWKQLAYEAHKHALEYFSVEELERISMARVHIGIRSDIGYSPYPHLGISIQSLAANTSWSVALHLARQIKVPRIELQIEWHQKKQAAYPGRRGRLFWEASFYENQ